MSIDTGKNILHLSGIIKRFYIGKPNELQILNGIDLDVNEGEFVSIVGASGSGKTTLLNILSTIDKPTQGSVVLDGKELTKIKNKELAKLRKDKIGFVFQDYNLLDTMTLQDNIALPLALGGSYADEIQEKVGELAALFGLSEHLKKYPYQLSGGQKQRGAVCMIQ